MYTVFLGTYRNTTAQDFTGVRYHARQYGLGYKCTYEYSSLGRNNCVCVYSRMYCESRLNHDEPYRMLHLRARSIIILRVRVQLIGHARNNM